MANRRAGFSLDESRPGLPGTGATCGHLNLELTFLTVI